MAVPFTRLSSDAREPTPGRVPVDKLDWTPCRHTNGGSVAINLRFS